MEIVIDIISLNKNDPLKGKEYQVLSRFRRMLETGQINYPYDIDGVTDVDLMLSKCNVRMRIREPNPVEFLDWVYNNFFIPITGTGDLDGFWKKDINHKEFNGEIPSPNIFDSTSLYNLYKKDNFV